jgi:hypothetical protein
MGSYNSKNTPTLKKIVSFTTSPPIGTLCEICKTSLAQVGLFYTSNTHYICMYCLNKDSTEIED